jgi:hypothetical protein
LPEAGYYREPVCASQQSCATSSSTYVEAKADAIEVPYLPVGELTTSITNFMSSDEASATKSLETIKGLFASKVLPLS